MPKSTKDKIATHQVLQALYSRYDESQGKYACVAEVADQTGGAKRRCDFMAMGCWPSFGISLHGHEIKVSRSDWQKELQDITKSETFKRHCHYWWLVFANKCAKLNEVPLDWGVMECLPSGTLKIRRQPTKRSPDHLPWIMVASLLRGAVQQARNKANQQLQLDEMYEAGREAERRTRVYELSRALKRADTAEETLRQIREAVQLKAGWWTDATMVRDIKAAMNHLQTAETDWVLNALERLNDQKCRIATAIAALDPENVILGNPDHEKDHPKA